MKVIPKSIHHLLDDSKGISKKYLQENYYDKDYLDENFVTEAELNLDDYVTLATAQTITGQKKLKNIALLNLPQSISQSDVEQGKSYLWVDPSGNYAVTPGGGVADVYPLTLNINGVATVYDPDTEAKTVSFLAPTSTQISNWNTAYSWGNHATQGYLKSSDLSNYVTLDTDQVITGKKTMHKIVADGYLAIPTAAPSSYSPSLNPPSGLTYLYADPNGNYSEDASGGVGEVYKLTLKKSSTILGTYDPAGGEDQIIDISNAFTGYATQSWVSSQGYLTTETDPTVPAWAKESSKPSYSLSEISGTTDLQLIEALTGTGLLKRKSDNTWELTDTSPKADRLSGTGTYTVWGQTYWENGVPKGNVSGSLTSVTDITGSGKITIPKGKFASLLMIPGSAPASADIVSGEYYIYAGTGSYGEDASGGVGSVYPLTVVINGSSTVYQPDESAETVTFGSASQKAYTSSIVANGTGLPTAGAVYTYVNNSILAAQPYKGVSSTAITDGGTEMPTISGYTTRTHGDVVAYDKKEFIWDTNDKWRLLGDEGSYALKTTQVIAGTGLAGGGQISQDVTLSLSTETQTSLGKADTAYQKPSGGIPKTDLASGVQTSLGLADSALQTSSMKVLTLVVGSTTIGSDYNALAAKTYTISKTNLTDTLESSSGYYVKKAGDTMTGDLTFDASSAAKEIKFGYASSGSGSAVKMGNDGKLYFGADQLTNNKDTYLYGGNISISWHREAIAGGNVAVLCSGNNFAPSQNNSIYLGHGSYRWATVYGVNFNASGTLTVTGVSTLSGGAKVSTMLAIPQSAPSSSASWYSANDYYLYADTSGNYSESAGGGVANVYPLTLTINGTSTVYNPGTAAQTISFLAPTSAQITAWNAKYDKPSGGIPGTDLATAYLPLAGGTMSNTNLVTNLNADKLDGNEGTYYNNFLTYYNGATPTANGITYPLALVQNGTPTGAWWYVTTMYYSSVGSNYYSQIATSYNATIPDMYIRQTYNGTATSWYKLYHTGNLTLSTLGGVPDTRKVNNKALSSDITLSLDDVADGSTRKLANYLPLSGGTMTGQILAPATNNSSAYGGAIRLREYNYVGTAQSDWYYCPSISFHWGDRYASRLGLRSDGKLAIDNYPLYHTNNLSLATLAGSSAVGSTSKPVYYNGSSLVACETSLTDYLPLAGGTMTGANPINFTENKVAIDFRPSSSSYSTKMMYSTNGNEAFMLSTANAVTSLIFNCGAALASTSSSVWNSIFSSSAPPTMQLKGKCVYINSFLPSGTNGAYNLYVGGTAYLEKDLHFDATTTTRDIIFHYGSTGASALRMATNGHIQVGAEQITRSKDTYVYGTNIYLTWNSTRQIQFTGDTIIPNSTNAISLGTSTNRWLGVYTKDLYADKLWGLFGTASESAAAFTRRATPSTAVGDSGVVKKIYGNTVAWNQLKDINTFTKSNATATISNGIITFLASAQNGYLDFSTSAYWGTNHKFYISFLIKGTSAASIKLQCAGSPDYNNGTAFSITTSWAKYSWICQRGTAWSGTAYPRMIDTRSSGWDNIYIGGIVMVDLTLAGLDSLTLAEFEALYPLGNYATTPGTLRSFTGSLAVKFNQMASAYDSSNWAVLSSTYCSKTTNAATQSIVLTSNSNTSAAKGAKLNNFSFVVGHKYYIRATLDAGTHIGFYASNNAVIFNTDVSEKGVVGEVTSSANYFGLRLSNSAASGTSFSFSKIVCIDLTTIFGQGCEPSASEFEQLCPERYYPPCTNEDMVIQGGLRTGGFNLCQSAPWNHSANTTWPAFAPDKFTRVTAGVQYSLSHSALGVTNWRHMYKAFDLNGNVITANLFTSADGSPYCNTTYGYWMEGSNNTWTSVTMTFAQDCYVYFGFGSGAVAATTPMPTDFCFNVYDATRNGQYEPHWESTLPLPITQLTSGGVQIFPNGLHGAGSVYDELTSTKAVKRMGIVDLGSLTWSDYTSDSTGHSFVCNTKSDAKTVSNNNTVANIKTVYTTIDFNDISVWTTKDKAICQVTGGSPNRWIIRDTAYSNAATFTTAMNGVYLVYELATPTEYTLDNPLPLHFKSDKLGTQEIYPNNATTPGSAPMKADFQYGSNLGDSAEANEGYLQKNGGRVSGELNVAGALAIPTQAPANPEVGKTYIYIGTTGSYIQ